MQTINFYSEDIEFSLSNQQQYVDWIFSFVADYKKAVSEVSYVFCSDSYLLAMNKEHLDHDFFTDIITFNYNVGNTISGDIFISIDTVRDNAKEFKTTFADELRRVMAHGVLHLCGFNDKTDAEQIEMTKQENECLKAFK